VSGLRKLEEQEPILCVKFIYPEQYGETKVGLTPTQVLDEMNEVVNRVIIDAYDIGRSFAGYTRNGKYGIVNLSQMGLRLRLEPVPWSLTKAMADSQVEGLFSVQFSLRWQYRNILIYKAPPNNEGYDLICIRPKPRMSGRQIRVQVKSPLASDGELGFLIKGPSLDAFDCLIEAFLNVGYFKGPTPND